MPAIFFGNGDRDPRLESERKARIQEDFEELGPCLWADRSQAIDPVSDQTKGQQQHDPQSQIAPAIGDIDDWLSGNNIGLMALVVHPLHSAFLCYLVWSPNSRRSFRTSLRSSI